MTPKDKLSPTPLPSVADDELVKPDTGLYDSEFWGVSRHELIADVAEGLLKASTATKIKDVLQSLVDQGFAASLADLAGWADHTKHRGPQADDDVDTKEFLSDPANKSRGKWHYVDLPLGSDGYSREDYPTLINDEDVVQITKTAIRVLQGTSDRFSQINALRLVIHLIGDLHQPIHVGCGYIDESGAVAKLVRNPDTVVQQGLDSDHGGNKLILPVGNNGVNLHSYWDSRLGGSNPDISDVEGDEVAITPELKKEFSDKLRRMIDEDAQLSSPGPEADAAADSSSLEDWIEDWTNESLDAARSAYKSIKIIGVNGSGFDVDWEGKSVYDGRCKPIVLERMKSAARNLATLLDAIYQ